MSPHKIRAEVTTCILALVSPEEQEEVFLGLLVRGAWPDGCPELLEGHPEFARVVRNIFLH